MSSNPVLSFSFATVILVLISSTTGMPKQMCAEHEACGAKECCAGYLLNKDRGICVARVSLGEECRPIILPGLQDCPCEPGLTCSRSSNKSVTETRSKFFCQKIPKGHLADAERFDDMEFMKHV